MDFGLDKIKGFQAATIFSVIAGAIIPGFLFLFIFERELFFSIDKFLLCLIAPALTLPILVLNAAFFTAGLIITFRNENISEQTRHNFFAMAICLGSVLTCIVVYITIIAGYLFQLTTKGAVYIMLVLEAIAVVVLIVSIIKEKR